MTRTKVKQRGPEKNTIQIDEYQHQDWSGMPRFEECSQRIVTPERSLDLGQFGVKPVHASPVSIVLFKARATREGPFGTGQATSEEARTIRGAKSK